MRPTYVLPLALALAAACNNNLPARRPQSRRPRPAAADVAQPVSTATTVNADPVSLGDGSSAQEGVDVEVSPSGVSVFRLGESNCVRDPARNNLGASATGFFGSSRAELEVRNIRYSCTPAPTYAAELDGDTIHLRVQSASRAALGRCSCRHDQFLQVTGIPAGDYNLVVEETFEDAGSNVLATGRVNGTAAGPAAGSTAPAEGGASSGAPN